MNRVWACNCLQTLSPRFSLDSQPDLHHLWLKTFFFQLDTFYQILTRHFLSQICRFISVRNKVNIYFLEAANVWALAARFLPPHWIFQSLGKILNYEKFVLFLVWHCLWAIWIKMFSKKFALCMFLRKCREEHWRILLGRFRTIKQWYGVTFAKMVWDTQWVLFREIYDFKKTNLSLKWISNEDLPITAT